MTLSFLGLLSLGLKLWSNIAPAHAHKGPGSCRAGQALIVGCTFGPDSDCPASLKNAILPIARELGVRIEWVNVGDFTRPQNPLTALSSIDALFSPGGKDIVPATYFSALPQLSPQQKEAYQLGAKPHGDLSSFQKQQQRDELELAIFRAYFSSTALAQTIPALGVCYGMQTMAVAHGVPLIPHLPQAGLPERYGVTDTVTLSSGRSEGKEGWPSLAQKIWNSPTLLGREEHHQAIDPQAAQTTPGVSLTGTSHEGAISEVIEFDRFPALGVQFHPEISVASVKEPLFRWFLESACKAQRKVIDDPTFIAASPAPFFKASRFLKDSLPGPRLCVDYAHQNLAIDHGRYLPLQRLLINDGWQWVALRTELTLQTLKDCKAVFISAAKSFIQPDEVRALLEWIEEGGSLLVAADHGPMATAPEALIAALGLKSSKAVVTDSTHPVDERLKEPGKLVISRDQIKKFTHLKKLFFFYGEAFGKRDPLPPDTRIEPLLITHSDSRFDWEDSNIKAPPPTPQDYPYLAALGTRKKGRWAVLGDGTLFLSKREGLHRERVGMNRPGSNNRELALELFRWLGEASTYR